MSIPIIKMLSRSLWKSIPDFRVPLSALPPTFLLPSRARYYNSTSQIIESPADSFEIPKAPQSSKVVIAFPSTQASKEPSPPTQPPAPEPQPKPLSDSAKRFLPLLRTQPPHYITAHIHARPYLVTQGDVLRLPFRMPHVGPGDVLRLNRASVIGSRDYTLKGAPYLDERIFECRATVLGTEGEPIRIKEKTKRRNRRVKTVRSKHKFTVLRIAELRIKALEELEG